jgi:hypothetical protein
MRYLAAACGAGGGSREHTHCKPLFPGPFRNFFSFLSVDSIYQLSQATKKSPKPWTVLFCQGFLWALKARNPKEELAMKETHDDVIREKKLPKVGDTVKSRKYGTLWRIIEKKEVWQSTVDETRLVPAIYLCFWKVAAGRQPGYGKMLGYAYTLYDNTFEANWEKANNS